VNLQRPIFVGTTQTYVCRYTYTALCLYMYTSNSWCVYLCRVELQRPMFVGTTQTYICRDMYRALCLYKFMSHSMFVHLYVTFLMYLSMHSEPTTPYSSSRALCITSFLWRFLFLQVGEFFFQLLRWCMYLCIVNLKRPMFVEAAIYMYISIHSDSKNFCHC